MIEHVVGFIVFGKSGHSVILFNMQKGFVERKSMEGCPTTSL
jgi:hypothetical protein